MYFIYRQPFLLCYFMYQKNFKTIGSIRKIYYIFASGLLYNLSIDYAVLWKEQVEQQTQKEAWLFNTKWEI